MAAQAAQFNSRASLESGLRLETAGLPVAATCPMAEADSMKSSAFATLHHGRDQDWAMLSDCEGAGCAGKRSHEAGSEGDGEAGPSKKPRAGFQACFLSCSTLHSGHEVAVYPCWGPYTVLACKKVAWGSRELPVKCKLLHAERNLEELIAKQLQQVMEKLFPRHRTAYASMQLEDADGGQGSCLSLSLKCCAGSPMLFSSCCCLLLTRPASN